MNHNIFVDTFWHLSPITLQVLLVQSRGECDAKTKNVLNTEAGGDSIYPAGFQQFKGF